MIDACGRPSECKSSEICLISNDEREVGQAGNKETKIETVDVKSVK